MSDKRLEEMANKVNVAGCINISVENEIFKALKQVQAETAKDCAKEVSTHWNDSYQMTNQKQQALRSSRVLLTKYGLKEGKEE